jgi:REP element-mobilizing transposase RayT
MKYNPKTHNRQSIRLKGYDYSQPGLYYITICVQNHRHLFGKIINGEMILNDAGTMIEKWYFEMENKYQNMKCDVHTVMPNHFHCIVVIVENINVMDALEGTSLCGRPEADVRPETDGRPETDVRPETPYGPDNKKYHASLFDMMDWFKTMTTNEYIRGVKNKNWPRFEKRLWQKRYWDHIIRDERSYINISDYIKNNPKKWDRDKFNL